MFIVVILLVNLLIAIFRYVTKSSYQHLLTNIFKNIIKVTAFNQPVETTDGLIYIDRRHEHIGEINVEWYIPKWYCALKIVKMTCKGCSF